MSTVVLLYSLVRIVLCFDMVQFFVLTHFHDSIMYVEFFFCMSENVLKWFMQKKKDERRMRGGIEVGMCTNLGVRLSLCLFL